MQTEKNSNKFTRTLIVALILFMATLVYISFFKSTPTYMLSGGIITVLLIMTILILSEAFDNFSLGQLLTVSREAKEKEKIVSSYKQENEVLRDNIVRLTAMVAQIQNQNTTNNNLLFSPDTIRHILGVEKADDTATDKEDELINEQSCEVGQQVMQRIVNEDGESNIISKSQELGSKRLGAGYWKRIEEICMEKYLKKYDIPKSELIREVQFSKGIDPIMERNFIFDGYIKMPQREHFVEMIRGNSLNPTMYYSTYVKLAKLMFYRQAKLVNVDMSLIIMKTPDTYSNGSYSNTDRFLEAFQPAIANGLLKIEIISISESEIDSLSETNPVPSS